MDSQDSWWTIPVASFVIVVLVLSCGQTHGQTWVNALLLRLSSAWVNMLEVVSVWFVWLSVVPGSELNPNVLSLATRSDGSSRSADLTVGHTAASSSMRSQSWMNTLSSASSVSKKSSGGAASRWLCFKFACLFFWDLMHCVLLW